MSNENFDEVARQLAQTAGEVKAFISKQGDAVAELRERMRDVEQKSIRRPYSGGGSDGGIAELTDLVFQSDGLAQFRKGNSNSVQISVPQRLLKTAVVNASGSQQPLVAADRRPGIVTAPQRKFTLRDILAAVPTDSNLVEFCRELSFSNAAAPQAATASPATIEDGNLKAESALTFELVSTPVITIAHFIPASRQVLSDAAALQQHIEQRLLYGLFYEEEDEMLNGSGAAGDLDGLVNNATAFTGGATNQTALDTIAKAMGQLIASEFSPTAIILNPADWLAIVLLKTTTGEYLLGDPQSMAEPRLFGLPVVATTAQTAGQFLVMDAPRAAYILDREQATIRLSENVGESFIRNMIHILAEERVGLAITNASAMVKGALLTAG